MSIRGVLFDATGTLIVPAEPVGETYARAAHRRGVEISGWRLNDAFRRVLDRSDPMVFPDAPDDEIPDRERDWWRAVVRSTFLAADSTPRFDDPDELFCELFDHFGRTEAWRICDGATAALEALVRLGLPLGIASNFDHRLPDILENIGFAGLFDSIMIPGRCGHAKPDPAFYTAAAAALSTPPGQTLHIGDDAERDRAAAERAGLQALCLDEIEGGWTGLPARVASLATLDRTPDEPPASGCGGEDTR